MASSTLRIVLKTGEELSMSAGLVSPPSPRGELDTQASLIVPFERIERFEDHGDVDWILLVEKEVGRQRLAGRSPDERPSSIPFVRQSCSTRKKSAQVFSSR